MRGSDDEDGSETASAGEPSSDEAMRPPVRDPVKERFEGEHDLYGLATWEARSGLDRLAVSVANSLRVARSRLLLSTALVLFLGQIGLAVLLVIEQPVLGVLAALSVVPALVVALTLWYWDPTTREPFELVAVTFLLSMLFASFAAVVNTLLEPGFAALGAAGLVPFYFLVVGPIEETVKWLAIRVRAYESREFKTVVDGVVYGAVAGLGFAAIENFVYVVGAAIEPVSGGGAGGVEFAALTAAARAFVGPGHVVFSAWAGFYLGLAKFNPDNWGPIVVKGLLIAAFIHGLYNSLVSIVPLGSRRGWRSSPSCSPSTASGSGCCTGRCLPTGPTTSRSTRSPRDSNAVPSADPSPDHSALPVNSSRRDRYAGRGTWYSDR